MLNSHNGRYRQHVDTTSNFKTMGAHERGACVGGRVSGWRIRGSWRSVCGWLATWYVGAAGGGGVVNVLSFTGLSDESNGDGISVSTR